MACTKTFKKAKKRIWDIPRQTTFVLLMGRQKRRNEAPFPKTKWISQEIMPGGKGLETKGHCSKHSTPGTG